MFVQSPRGMTSGGNMTFQELAPSTLFFSDRPERGVEHVSSMKFIHQWGEGENSFTEDPPNAVASFLEEENSPSGGDRGPTQSAIERGCPYLYG